MKKEGKGLLIQNLTVYSFGHGVVDFFCAFILFSIIRTTPLSYNYIFNIIASYSIIGFGLQAVVGMLCDKLRAPKAFGIAGLLFSLSAVSFMKISPIFAIVLLGIGNAVYHIGGATICLNITPKKATAPGIFVSPGAMGLFLGVLVGKTGLMPLSYSIALVILSIILIFITKTPKIDYQRKVIQKLKIFWLILTLILLSVVIRSFIGFMVVFPWKSKLILGIIFTLGVVFGKIFGGILADKFGLMKIGVSSLLISAFLLAFGANNPVIGVIGIFLFNMTMPITLIATSNMLQGRPGLAFGLTVVALIVGALPYYAEITLPNNPFHLVTIFVSATALYVGLHFYNKYNKSNNSNQNGTKR